MSSDESWLVTGINGCIGAWVGLTLAKEDKRVVGLDRSDRNYRLRLICTPEQLARIGAVNGDVADLDLLVGPVLEGQGMARAQSASFIALAMRLVTSSAPRWLR